MRFPPDCVGSASRDKAALSLQDLRLCFSAELFVSRQRLCGTFVSLRGCSSSGGVTVTAELSGEVEHAPGSSSSCSLVLNLLLNI